MLKVGDNLLCKKNLSTYFRNGEFQSKFEKGKSYKILGINNIYIRIKFRYNAKPIGFWLVQHRDKRFFYYIWDYFYTTKEIRKLKLKQLKQC